MGVLQELLPPDGSRLLVLTNDFPPKRGGIQTFVQQLCEELPSKRVVVYAPAFPEAVEHDNSLPFEVVRDPTGLLLPTPALLGRLRRVIAARRVGQVLYGSSVPLGLFAPSLRRAGIARQVALTHGHEVWWAALPGSRQLLRRVARHVDALTYVSEYTGARIGRSLPERDRKKLVRLSPRADSAFNREVDGSSVRRELGIPATAPVAVCVARLVRRKGQDRLIRIWPAVLQRVPDAYLLIVGSGPDYKRLRKMVDRRGLQDRVLMTGEVAHTATYYAAGDVFALPVRSRYFGLEVEGYGISTLEAVACGLRVVVGDSGGALEALQT